MTWRERVPDDVAEHLEETLARGVDPIASPAEARRRTNARIAAECGAGEDVRIVEDLTIEGVPARLFRPTGNEHAVLVWFHGGGWSAGSVDAFDGVTRVLANRAGEAVLAVDYRLAPEHPFPAGIDDAWSATRWACAEFGQVAVGGDSAGGNVAAVTALRARDAGLALQMQLLVYPALDYRPDSESYKRFAAAHQGFPVSPDGGDGPAFRELVRGAWEGYIPDEATRLCRDASPLRASCLAGLPPTLIFAAEHDILYDEAEEYAARLRADDVAVTFHAYEGQVHGFFHMLTRMRDALRAVEAAGRALRDSFAPSLPGST
jgi:acetyl esterase/lipase